MFILYVMNACGKLPILLHKLYIYALMAVGKTRRGVGAEDQWVKPGDWELGDHVNEVCCFDSKLEWVKVCSKFEDVWLLQW